jgi:hypothetical protein
MVYVYGIVCPDTATKWRSHGHDLVNIERKNGRTKCSSGIFYVQRREGSLLRSMSTTGPREVQIDKKKEPQIYSE